MSYGNKVKFEKQGKIGILTLNNPAKLNSITQEFFDELKELNQELENRYDIHALVIFGEGKHFCSGFDVSYLQSMNQEISAKTVAQKQRLYTAFQELPYPVISGVQGVCYGAGVEVILATDIRIVADNARISLLENRYGLAASMGGTTRLTKLVGPGNAKRLLMSCDEIGAEEALRMGIAQIVKPVEELRAFTLEYANKLAEFPTAGNRFIKMGVNNANESSVTSGLQFEVAVSNYSLGTADFKEATAAFLEKRKPNYQGEYQED